MTSLDASLERERVAVAEVSSRTAESEEPLFGDGHSIFSNAGSAVRSEDPIGS